MSEFTPVSSLIGGALIGLAAVMLLALNGRIAGISGISAGLFAWRDRAPDWAWRLSFIAGLVAAPLILLFGGKQIPEVTFVAGMPEMAVAGLLVGFGTVIANGCTSGHGVCGIARLSPRSLVATAVFMGAGIITVFIVRHVIGNA